MIIKITFNDNDFTQILESFFDSPLFSGLNYCLKKYSVDDEPETLNTYRNLSVLIETYLHKLQDEKNFTKEDKKHFIEILKESILDFIKDRYRDNLEYLSKQLTIRIQDSVTDHWENGEAVYYFPTHDKYITM